MIAPGGGVDGGGEGLLPFTFSVYRTECYSYSWDSICRSTEMWKASTSNVIGLRNSPVVESATDFDTLASTAHCSNLSATRCCI